MFGKQWVGKIKEKLAIKYKETNYTFFTVSKVTNVNYCACVQV